MNMRELKQHGCEPTVQYFIEIGSRNNKNRVTAGRAILIGLLKIIYKIYHNIYSLFIRGTHSWAFFFYKSFFGYKGSLDRKKT